MPEAAVAPAPAAASTPAPASSAPSSAPAPAAAPAPVSTPASVPSAPVLREIGHSGVKSAVNPADYPIREDYEKAIMAEKLGSIPAVVDEPAPVEEVSAPVEEVVPETAPEVPAPDAEVEPEPAAEEPEFQLEPEAIVTPESLTQMVTDNPEFGKLLEADPRLKGQLYKTAREAAELQPYREIFPDLESAKEAATGATAFNNVREVFMGSTTKEGTVAALGKMAELCYERDDQGNVLMENGSPVIGEDFYGFVDNVVRIDLENRASEVEARLSANQYHKAPGIDTQEQAQEAYDRDYRRLQVLKDEIGELPTEQPSEQLPEHLRRKAEELSQREKDLIKKQHSEQIVARQKYDGEVETETQKRIQAQIDRIFASVEKQGAVISPFVKQALNRGIRVATFAKMKGNPAIRSQLEALQKLPISDEAKARRLAAVDRVIQQYMPDAAREQLREAGVQIANASAARRAKVEAQAKTTKETEIAGSRGASLGGAPMSSSAAFDHAQAEWQKGNPGKPFDKVARESILPRVLQLMTSR